MSQNSDNQGSQQTQQDSPDFHYKSSKQDQITKFCFGPQIKEFVRVQGIVADRQSNIGDQSPMTFRIKNTNSSRERGNTSLPRTIQFSKVVTVCLMFENETIINFGERIKKEMNDYQHENTINPRHRKNYSEFVKVHIIKSSIRDNYKLPF